MIDIEKAIKWFENRKGKVSYSKIGMDLPVMIAHLPYIMHLGVRVRKAMAGLLIQNTNIHGLQRTVLKRLRTIFPGMPKEEIFLSGEKRKIIVQVLDILEFSLTKIELFTVTILQMEFLWIITINSGFMQADRIILYID